MAVNMSSFAKLAWPGLNSIYGTAYSEHPLEYVDIFETRKSQKAFEEIIGSSMTGMAAVKPEGGAIVYDDMTQGFTSRFQHVAYGLGIVITEELVEDDQYDVIGPMRAKALARSMRTTKETVAANILNRAFNTSYLGGDGLELCSAVHVNAYGGTFQNELSTAADLSEAALEQMCIDTGKWTDDRGNKIAVQVTDLIIPVDLMFEADRIVNSSGRVGTADNDKNAIMGKFNIKVNHYLTDTDAFFLKTNVDNGLIHFERREDRFDMDNDFDTSNAKFKATGRYSFGWADPKGIYGSPGAA